MEVIDYSGRADEFQRLLQEAGPCEECGFTENMALMVVTTLEDHGSFMIYCENCVGADDLDRLDDPPAKA